MKKHLCFLLVLVIMTNLLCGCSERERFMFEEGKDYKNPSLELEYISYNMVRVTFAVDLCTSPGEVTAHIVLLSENSMIGECELTARYMGNLGTIVVAEDVRLTYHNGNEITAYVDHLSGTYYK